MANKVDLMVDSGAFSAWKKKETLSVKKYSRFLDKHADCFDSAINLDVIPGGIGRGLPSGSEVEASAAAGWKNLLRLRKDGHNVVPVYHLGERRYWLEKMIGEGFTYIGLSPTTKRDQRSKQAFMDKMFGYLCGVRGYPEIRVHGFAMTSLPLMFRYPWYSVDSVTWMLVPSYGAIMVPQVGADGKYDYSQAPNIVKVSRRKRNGVTNSTWAQHIDQMGPHTKKCVLRYLESEGLELGKLHDSPWERMRQVVRFFKRVEEFGSAKKFTGIEHGLVIPDKRKGSRTAPPPLRIIYSLCLGWQHSDILADEKVRNRLLTYYWFIDKQPIDIHRYVKTGRIPHSKKVKE